MAASWLAMKRKRRHLTGRHYLMGHIQWLYRRVFCPRAKPPLLVQALTPTPALLPSATKSDVLHPLLLTESLIRLPLVQPDLLSLLLFNIALLLPHTKRRRTPARHVQPQGPKQAGHLWMPSFLLSSSSSSGTTLVEPQPEKMLHWVSLMCTHRVSLSHLSSSWTTRITTFRPQRPQLTTVLLEPVMVLVLFLHHGANWGSLLGRGWTFKCCNLDLGPCLCLINIYTWPLIQVTITQLFNWDW